ncbi:cytochrome ubiquinol oxidase subunit I [Mesosutterella sp. AGMB02718]|uniref:Cytochrome ubiquinol oxidase subunit I n=1 Tax=Mesosutterella faecium TaxID=2925194 RepID=A0ABT7IK90_9BURK|nr:cytochrome ubiquinol oxidase subunit I [Mesosutterella sp. AGMB02718]MDL2058789.1 cytochrome ubiquinol oxidase subunit I [Mesosutterella sp. AGMB02718]
MITPELVDLSRLQFAVTALYHYLFVPLTLGLSMLLVAMEGCYVITKREVYRDMTRFWGKLFAINFAMGVATGITMEFQFGTNWAYYSHYVGDIFGPPLAFEALMAFFLESTFAGLFFFGWKKLRPGVHWLCTFLMAFGTNISALWILVANSWMQHPVGSEFNPVTLRMEMSNFWEVISSEWAQATLVHDISGGYMTGAVFVAAISAWYLLKKRDVEFAKRSLAVACAFGLVTSIVTVHMGDESGYLVTRDQPEKIAAMEAIWDTAEAPAGLTLFALPNTERRANALQVEFPWVLGLIGTRSLSTPVPGINQLEERNAARIASGAKAVTLLEQLRKDPSNAALLESFNAVKKDLGYGLLLRKYTSDVSTATPEMIKKAAADTIPPVSLLFWSFRGMVTCGIIMLLLFVLGFYYSVKGIPETKGLYLKLAALALPLPWIANELGWIVTEVGRQPWTIYGVLPVHISVSSLTAGEVLGSLAGFALLYSALLIVEVWLMKRFASLGPSTLGTGRYFHEKH